MGIVTWNGYVGREWVTWKKGMDTPGGYLISTYRKKSIWQRKEHIFENGQKEHMFTCRIMRYYLQSWAILRPIPAGAAPNSPTQVHLHHPTIFSPLSFHFSPHIPPPPSIPQFHIFAQLVTWRPTFSAENKPSVMATLILLLKIKYKITPIGFPSGKAIGVILLFTREIPYTAWHFGFSIFYTRDGFLFYARVQ